MPGISGSLSWKRVVSIYLLQGSRATLLKRLGANADLYQLGVNGEGDARWSVDVRAGFRQEEDLHLIYWATQVIK